MKKKGHDDVYDRAIEAVGLALESVRLLRRDVDRWLLAMPLIAGVAVSIIIAFLWMAP